ncbi:hypothetical protein ACFFX0_32935 [Citricoccus parietis]|uniref:Uncharacterized protein n=1 Tax=Citricoccus parietis TaxID=592307 RepID=A0ABV5G9Y0_9MICC
MPDHRALHHFMGHYSGHVSDSSLLSAHPYFRLGPETPAQPRWWKHAVEVERARQGQAQLRLILSPLRQFLIAGVDGLRMLSWAFRSACGRRGAVQLRAPRQPLPAMTMSGSSVR